jgi:hypothetical protein
MKAQKPELVPGKSRYLRRKRMVKAVRAVESGMKDTERRGIPSDVPNGGARRRRV